MAASSSQQQASWVLTAAIICSLHWHPDVDCILYLFAFPRKRCAMMHRCDVHLACACSDAHRHVMRLRGNSPELQTAWLA